MGQTTLPPIIGVFCMTPSSKLGGGLYAITPGSRDDLVVAARLALAGGARLLQYRDKSGDHGRRIEEARALRALCVEHQVPLIINDDVGLAKAVGAHGVHLGERDVSVAEARTSLGPEAIIGVSCYNSLERARMLAAQRPDYLAFGAFFDSPTKPHAPRATLDLLRQAAALGLPLVAIGGITADNGADLVEAGADYLAVITGVFGAADIRAAAARVADLFSPQR